MTFSFQWLLLQRQPLNGGVVLFAHVRKKQSTGKSKRDRHDRQYNQGGKHRPNNPNRRKGANERKNKGKIID